MNIDEVLEVLGNESRRKILSLLAKKPCYVSEISYSLKMAPKAVLEHLEKLEKVGLIKSFEEGRRRYYYIDKNIRLEISITPHRFYADITAENRVDLEKTAENVVSLLKNFDFRARTISEINAMLERIEELQRAFSKLQSAINSKINELFESILDEIERICKDDTERLVLLGLAKGLCKTAQIADELGLPYMDVERTLESLRRRGLVEKVVVGEEIVWKIR
jgi:ArsR family transcriptional regulator